jgi:hypothetical protein
VIAMSIAGQNSPIDSTVPIKHIPFSIRDQVAPTWPATTSSTRSSKSATSLDQT